MRRLLVLPLLLAALVLLAACGSSAPKGADPKQVDAMNPPTTGLCRNLTRVAMTKPTDATRLVDCSEPHNAETFAAGELPGQFKDTSYSDPALDTWAYTTCTASLKQHLGASDSSLMRSLFTWVWFRPSEKAWDKGARWWRCDVLAGGDHGQHYLDLPTVTAGLLSGSEDDHWMACARGEDVTSGTRVACNQSHGWRAVTTIKVGEVDDPWPGTKAVQAKTKQFCSSSVAAWLGYPTDYDYGFTWFGEPEWKAGNRRSVCWARTDQ
ncbi:septum formation family protein [Nocardioides sp. Kera G14]|uniref:septum formation family protein n=1 Tax=Nocardioides sp. Kera G14 TaxID=2884264 RepID=UPI001D123CE3|nr:septum formation family protein [Nocardioides sp. Kera G14]UDY24843.1 septum formation family protein [Nocardioides sp. Kera G14]